MNTRPLALAAVLLPTAAALAQPYNDGQGREWRQLTETTGLSWNQVASVCPPGTPCAGSVGGRDLTGWTWASPAQVQALFATFEPAMLSSQCLSGSPYFLSAIGVAGGAFQATQQFYTTVGGYQFVGGWTSGGDSNTGRTATSSSSYNMGPFNGSFCVTGAQPAAAPVSFHGVWLYRPVACTTCCEPDLTTGAIAGQAGYGVPNGVLDNEDFFYYLAQFAAGNLGVADLTTGAIQGLAGYGVPNGVIDNEDFFYYLAVFAAGC